MTGEKEVDGARILRVGAVARDSLDIDFTMAASSY